MKDDAQNTTSVWMATADTPSEPRLTEDIRTDVCIVGAGIAGMTTAYLLAREGRAVVVLDDGAIGGGMTGRTTAHLTNAFDDRYVEMERLHGEEGSRFIAESHTAAIDKIEEIISREAIDCGFERVDGFLFVPPGESTSVLDDELVASRRADAALLLLSRHRSGGLSGWSRHCAGLGTARSSSEVMTQPSRRKGVCRSSARGVRPSASSRAVVRLQLSAPNA